MDVDDLLEDELGLHDDEDDLCNGVHDECAPMAD